MSCPESLITPVLLHIHGRACSAEQAHSTGSQSSNRAAAGISAHWHSLAAVAGCVAQITFCSFLYAAPCCTDAGKAQAAVMTAFDYVMRNGGADFSPPGPSHRRLQTASSADAVSKRAKSWFITRAFRTTSVLEGVQWHGMCRDSTHALLPAEVKLARCLSVLWKCCQRLHNCAAVFMFCVLVGKYALATCMPVLISSLCR
jgi:hypothetical protein